MRSFILIAAVILANAINPDDNLAEGTIKFIAILFIIGFIMDVFELLK